MCPPEVLFKYNMLEYDIQSLHIWSHTGKGMYVIYSFYILLKHHNNLMHSEPY